MISVPPDQHNVDQLRKLDLNQRPLPYQDTALTN